MALAPDHPPEAAQEAAEGEDQVRVADPPTVMEAGETERVMVGVVGIETGGGGTAPEARVVKFGGKPEGRPNSILWPAVSADEGA